MKKLLQFLIAFSFASGTLHAQYSALNFTLVSNINPESGVNGYGDKYSGCWGWYQATKNKEYAIACSKSGTYWVNVTNPLTPTVSAFRSGAFNNATWREVKTYSTFCYVISDDGGNNQNNSFQIFDMQYLPDSVHKVYDGKSLFKRGHALWVDGSKLYVSGVTYSNNTTSLLNVYSLATPTAPLLLRSLEQDAPFINYVHDAFVRNDTVYASCAYQGLYVFHLLGNNTFQQLGSLTSYPYSGYNHASALTPNGQTLVFTDEVPDGLPIKTANVSNLSNIQVLGTTNQFTATTPHNPFMVNNQYCFLSSYQEGIQLYDISSPSSPTLAGYFDTYPQGGGNTGTWGNNAYKGQWGSYPYLPSKTIFALDMNNGIFLLRTSLYANPQVTAGFSLGTLRCAGLSMSVTNTSSGATNYTWTFSGGTASTTVQNPTVSFATPGIHTITLLSSNPSYSASFTQTLAVPGNSNIVNTITSTNVACNTCSTGAAVVTASGGIAPYSYSWAPNGGSNPTINNLPVGCYTVTVKDAALCTKSSEICIGAYTGLENQNADGSISVYPNPAHHEVFISSKGTFNCDLFDLSGKLIVSKKDNKDLVRLSLDKLSAGVYLLEVDNGSEKTRKKLVIE